MVIGYALTGSFCTFEKSVRQIEKLKNEGYDIIPVMSENAFSTSTRFGDALYFTDKIQNICGHEIISTVKQAEPIGPKKLLDLLVVSACTGNTLGKLAGGIYDTSVTLAVKAHLRNQRPVLIGVSTNDALSGSAKSIGTLFNLKNYYFIPMKQDDPVNKPQSVVADFEKTCDAVKCALEGKQIQPVLC
ncbi:MAG: dipicolinate synthase subunit B [Clostridia bacterium]|nr:dipicolinate synthase subunit B [Clostridia bacterium]